MENKDNEVFLSKDAILKADDIKMEVVSVPEWGGSVYVGMLTAEERDEFEMSCLFERKGQETPERNLKNMKARLCSLTLRDENGKRLFSMSEAGKLGKKSAKALNRVYDVSCRLNGIGQQDEEELTKN